MNSLMNYGSDDDSQEEKPVDPYVSSGRNYKRSGTGAPTDDTNYDEVQMSLSEDSDAESKSPSKHSRDRERDERRNSPKIRESSNRDRREDRLERDRCSGRDRNEDRSRRDRDRDDERSRPRDEKDDRTRSRDDDKNRDRTRDRDDDKRDRRARSRDRYSSRDDRYRSDRDRRRSRSPRDRERRRSRSPRRSRSRSRDRNSRGGFQRRFDRGNKIDKNDFKDRGNNSSDTTQDQDMQKDRFFMPGITGRFRDQIEKRKLLWQKKEPEVPTAPIPATSQASQNTNAPRATKVWESTTFAQDTDGKVASKFKRLMGIRSSGEGGSSTNSGGTILKKQDEMFNAMEQQYEVARTTTHTMRGVGLGFSSFNR